MINPVYRVFDTAKNLIKTSSYRLYHNRLYIYDIVRGKWYSLKKQSVYDTYNGKLIKQVVKEIKK